MEALGDGMPRPVIRFLSLGFLILAEIFSGLGRSAAQETELPPVIVSAPSPIQHRVAKQNGGNAPATQTASEPESANPWLPSFVADTFNSMIVMTEPEIQRTTGSTLGAILFEKPGMSATTFAPAGAS